MSNKSKLFEEELARRNPDWEKIVAAHNAALAAAWRKGHADAQAPALERIDELHKQLAAERDKLPLLEQYRLFFNESRNAQIECIGSASTDDPTNREIRIRYEDGHEVSLGDDVMTWVGLFDQLSAMHPRPASLPK